jgi:chromosome segregation ATPase
LKTKLSEFQEFNKKIEDVKESKYQCMLDENEIGSKRQEINNSLVSSKNRMEGFYGNSSLSSVIRLVEEANKLEMKGIIGIMANVIKIFNNKFLPLFESLFKKQIFSILVEKEEDVFPLIKLNTQLKGGKIMIIPLEWHNPDNGKEKNLNQTHNNSMINISLNDSTVGEIIMFNDCYEIKSRFQDERYYLNLKCCLNNIFKKGAIVQNIKGAFEIAKQKKLDCITMDLQIVYAGGHHTKAGYHSKKNMHYEAFDMYHRLLQDLENLQNEFDSIQERKRSIQTQEEENTKEIQEYKDQILKLESEIESFVKGRDWF